MMKNEVLTTCRKGIYKSPSATVICLEQMMTFCASNGQTQDYESGSIWELGDDNE